ncbi:hypothetical protein V6Z12_A09G233600 [Gossypium hirsutum]
MENAVTLNLDCKITLRWRSSINSDNKRSILIQTHFPKPTRHCCCLSSLRSSPSTPRRPPDDGCSSKTHTTLLVETYHHHRRLRALIEKLEKEGSCPMQILGDDGDWTKNDFWAAVKFLRHAFRSNEILQYDDISVCLKTMELDGCLPDHFTYNLLIREFSRGGLLQKMERVYRFMISKKMNLQSSSLVAMLEAYANFGILDKMEKVYRKVVNSSSLKEDTVRKLANVYIKNYMFSRLDDLGIDLSSRTGRNNLVWCLRLLSHACLLSGKGMDSVIQEMDEAKALWNVTIVNIILLAYLKMKDFSHLRNLLSQLPSRQVRPDLTTVGILFDAIEIGFDGAKTLETWRKMVLYRAVELNTDPLVLTAFGKGHFLRDCEEAYSSLEPKARDRKTWTYHQLIDLVIKHKAKQS